MKLRKQSDSKRKFYLSIVMTMTLFIVFTILILSSVLYVNFERAASDQIYLANMESLKKVDNEVSIMSKTALTISNQIFRDLSVSKLMYYSVPDIFDMSLAVDQLTNYRLSIPFIDSIYVYNRYINRIYIEPGTGATIQSTEQEFSDKQIMDIIGNYKQYKPYEPIPRIYINSDGVTKYLYTFIMYDYVAGGKILYNSIFVNISEDWINNVITDSTESKGSNTFIINNKGVSVSHNNVYKMSYSFSASEVLHMKYKNGYTSTYGLVANYDSPKELQTYWGSADFTADMKMFKRWADEGLWSRSALSAKTDTEAFINGKTIAVLNGFNAAKFGDTYSRAAVAHPDWKIGYTAFPTANAGKFWPNHATQNAYFIPTTAQNPERALMFYQKLILDKTYNQLTSYGFEGQHYTVDSEGYYVPVGDPTKSGFRREGMNCWGWRNPDFMIWNKTDQILKDTFAADAKNAGPNEGDGFAEDYTAYQAQRAALGTVMTQYLAPLQAGLVTDVDAAVKTFMDKANEAGLQTIQDAVKKQWADYAATQGW